MDEFRDRAWALVEAERQQIRAVAQALLQHRRLSGADLTALLPFREPEGRLWVT